MVVKYNTIALVAVKGNSERIPKKNIRPFGSTSLLELKLNQLIKSNCVDKIVVSSEDQDVLDIAASFENVLIHKRNSYYSSSEVPMSEVYSNTGNNVFHSYTYISFSLEHMAIYILYHYDMT
jgi:CMP-N-acetylneuraminic acid synthetase